MMSVQLLAAASITKVESAAPAIKRFRRGKKFIRLSLWNDCCVKPRLFLTIIKAFQEMKSE